ncbi:tRNA (N(6)-L-threonylcarbamoyladenosine(37)-C(2))-methylthiotransferase MtaB [Mediterraneibacter butyricigenes]|uniref:Threonylcarbamoyladenosine tRNA methylthiotransferase MtaB n=1 Tax=Mediterraneibacter butyricigenes TaxID=2316025 RepID=A0A391P2L1_9FIRM|nr:tRNA (N(6)-L-threonylcarbamoyladenosine(37)-C(2))-methylthiotransferase MtaB [Mediterraneibacter butyricigenes]
MGCKVNAYETEAMQEMLEQNGYEIVPFQEGADVYIINTCTVTNMADRKSRQMIHKARKMNPEAVVVAAGCYVQTAEMQEKLDPDIDIVIGNNRKQDLIRILAEYWKEETLHPEQVEELIDINHTKEYENLTLDRTAEHTRAYIKVQDGCNQFCSYCIIPFARGRVRSRKAQDVTDEVRRLAENGYKEVVLTGIHLSSYGMDLEKKEDLLHLIQSVHEVEGIERIRLGSLEPRIITEEFAETLASLPKICPHFHLSMQSGCDETLKRMNRRYTSAEYFEKCEILRSAFEHPALTTDVIVGFPQESEEEFEITRKFIEKVNFYETHVFKYSKRQGTKAAAMEGQIPEPVKGTRSAELIRIGKEHKKAFESWYIGKEIAVLFEEEIERDGQKIWVGHTREIY